MFTRGFYKTAVSLAAYEHVLSNRVARVASALAEAKKKKIKLPKELSDLEVFTKSDISGDLVEIAKRRGISSQTAAEKAPARKFFSGELVSAWPKKTDNQAVLKNLRDDISFVSDRLRGADKEINDYVSATAYERTLMDRARAAAPLEAAAKLQNANRVRNADAAEAAAKLQSANRAEKVKQLADEAKAVQDAASKNKAARNYVLGGLGLGLGGAGLYSYRNKTLQDRRDEALRTQQLAVSPSISGRVPGSTLISESFE